MLDPTHISPPKCPSSPPSSSCHIDSQRDQRCGQNLCCLQGICACFWGSSAGGEGVGKLRHGHEPISCHIHMKTRQQGMANKINGNEWLSKWINGRNFCFEIQISKVVMTLCLWHLVAKARKRWRAAKLEIELYYIYVHLYVDGKRQLLSMLRFYFNVWSGEWALGLGTAYLKLNICTPWAFRITKIYFTYAHTNTLERRACACACAWVCECACGRVVLSFACALCVCAICTAQSHVKRFIICVVC